MLCAGLNLACSPAKHRSLVLFCCPQQHPGERFSWYRDFSVILALACLFSPLRANLMKRFTPCLSGTSPSCWPDSCCSSVTSLQKNETCHLLHSTELHTRKDGVSTVPQDLLGTLAGCLDVRHSRQQCRGTQGNSLEQRHSLILVNWNLAAVVGRKMKQLWLLLGREVYKTCVCLSCNYYKKKGL